MEFVLYVLYFKISAGYFRIVSGNKFNQEVPFGHDLKRSFFP